MWDSTLLFAFRPDFFSDLFLHDLLHFDFNLMCPKQSTSGEVGSRDSKWAPVLGIMEPHFRFAGRCVMEFLKALPRLKGARDMTEIFVLMEGIRWHLTPDMCNYLAGDLSSSVWGIVLFIWTWSLCYTWRNINRPTIVWWGVRFAWLDFTMFKNQFRVQEPFRIQESIPIPSRHSRPALPFLNDSFMDNKK